ncbi:MAG: hypothetical protein U0350_06840 [Caldilineaceae bacterium]
MTEQTTQEAVAEIWRLFKETDAKFKETDAKFKETDARLDQRFRETDAEIKATAAEIKATNASLRRLEGLFGSQWGRLMEALVKPGVLALFQERGHQVRRLHQRSTAQRDGDMMEIDLILEDSTEVIVGEVKSSVGVEEVNAFLTDLAEFTSFFPLYRGYQVYGAIAGLEISAEVARYAYRRGLFVLSIGKEGFVTILNDNKFRPRDCSQG